MENEVKVIVGDKTAELVIRHGDAAKVYDPVALDITGCIDTVSRFLQNRIEQISTFTACQQCNIQVNREEGAILLLVNETDYFGATIWGKLDVHPDIKKFGINSGEYMSPEKMANHLKMRKHLFDSQSEYSLVYSALKAFKAKVGQEIDAIKDDRGNYELKKTQAVEHNIPSGFLLKIPLFKGTDKVSIPVEFMVNSSLDVALSSTDLIQLTDEIREQLIDNEVKAIQEITKEIVIINI
jgi:hypothetical protein